MQGSHSLNIHACLPAEDKPATAARCTSSSPIAQSVWMLSLTSRNSIGSQSWAMARPSFHILHCPCQAFRPRKENESALLFSTQHFWTPGTQNSQNFPISEQDHNMELQASAHGSCTAASQSWEAARAAQLMSLASRPICHVCQLAQVPARTTIPPCLHRT